MKNLDFGGVTAEFAITLPAVVAITALLIGVGSLQFQAAAVGQRVGLLARAVELGKTDQELKSLASQLGLAATITGKDGLVCVESPVDFRLAGFDFGSSTARACGLRPGF